MMTDLDSVLQKMSELAREDRYEEAIDLSARALIDNPDAAELFAKRGYVRARSGDYRAAAAEATQAIQRNAGEPDYFYSRGRYLFAIGEDEKAVRDFEEVAALSKKLANDYYLEPALYMKAEALVRLGRAKEAIEALATVRDDFETHLDRPRSKRVLLAECYRKLAR